MNTHQGDESPSIESPKGFTLSNADRLRLELIAPWFNIGYRAISEDCAEILPDPTDPTQAIVVSMAIAHKRLMAEVCSRAGPWVYFHFGMSCRDSLMGLTDARLRRIGDLYRLSLTQPHSPA